MSESKVVALAWASYREQVIPVDAGVLQVTECRRAFYAGAECLLVALTQILDPGTEPTEADVARVEALHKELLAFAAEVGKGAA